jgi:hypothetical protein
MLEGASALGHDVFAELDHVIVIVIESGHSVRSRLRTAVIQNEMVSVEARFICRPVSGLGTKEIEMLIS